MRALVLALLVALPGASANVLTDLTGWRYAPHPPIRFAGTPDALGLLAAGVTGGQGTAEDPWRIEGWQILPLPGGVARPAAAIAVEDTEAYVVVEGNLAEGFLTGVEVRNASHVVVRGNVVRHNDVGVRVGSAWTTLVEGNDLARHRMVDVWLTDATEARVEGNTLADSAKGVLVDASSYVVVARNRVAGAQVGIELFRGQFHEVQDNTVAAAVGVDLVGGAFHRLRRNVVASTEAGFRVDGSENPVVIDSRVTGSGIGLRMLGGHAAAIVHNSFSHLDEGIAVVDGDHHDLFDNDVIGNTLDGVRVERGFETEVGRSNIEGNGFGLRAVEVAVEALGNFWGSSNGPTAPDHPGGGDLVSAGVAYAPFAAAHLRGAGPR